MADNSLLHLFRGRKKKKRALQRNPYTSENFLWKPSSTFLLKQLQKYRKINGSGSPWKKNYIVKRPQKRYQNSRKFWETVYKITLQKLVMNLQPERNLQRYMV